MAVNLIQTSDEKVITEIISDPFIWSRLSDGIELADYNLELSEDEAWFIAKEDDNTIGVITLEAQTSCSLGLYFYLYKEHRNKSREVVNEVLSLFKTTEYEKLNVSIPECYMTAVNLALKMGFKKEGINRRSYQKENTYYDRILLGITRGEA